MSTSILSTILASNNVQQASSVTGNSASASDSSQQSAGASQGSGFGPSVIIDISPQALAALSGNQSGGTSGQSADAGLSALFSDLSSLFGAASGNSSSSSNDTAFDQILATLTGGAAGTSATAALPAGDSTAGSTSANPLQIASNGQAVAPHHGHHHHHDGGAEQANASNPDTPAGSDDSSQDPLAQLLGTDNTASSASDSVLPAAS